jgi:hypothetical protein
MGNIQLMQSMHEEVNDGTRSDREDAQDFWVVCGGKEIDRLVRQAGTVLIFGVKLFG